MIGRTVSHYRIVETLGEGGMASVYKAIDMNLDRPVAIKVLHQYISRDAAILERFRSEATLLARLNHPNIATLYEFFCESDEFFMVMEYVPGKTLARRLREDGPFPPHTAVEYICKILEGLDHAHQLGVQHRDIKPANILITESGKIKITDFGIARALGTDRLTRDARLVGTIEYLAPERIKGQEGDNRSDIYAVGVLLYELLSLQIPFQCDSDFDLMRAHVEEVPCSLRKTQLASAIPNELDAVVLRALAKQPEDRWPTAAAMMEALSSVSLGPEVQRGSKSGPSPEPVSPVGNVTEAAPATRPKPSPSVSRPPFYRDPVALVGLGCAAFVVLFAVFVSVTRSSPAHALKSAPPVILKEPTRIAPSSDLGTIPHSDLGSKPAEHADTAKKAQNIQTFKAKDGARRSYPEPEESSPKIITLRDVRKLYIAKMPNDLDAYLRAALSKKLGTFFVVVLNRSEADAILQNIGGGASNAVSIVDSSGKYVLWSGSADDKQRLYLNLRHGGPREIADKLATQLKKALD